MDASPLLALERLRRTSARTLARAAVQELVERDVVRLHPYGPAGRERPGLTDGAAPLPTGALLSTVARVVRRTPTHDVDGRVVRDLRRVAQRLAALGHELPDAALQDLAAAGLVEQGTHRVLGLLERRTWQRTPAGDEALQRQHGPRVQESSDSGAVVVASSGDGPDRRGGWTDELDRGFDASFDGGSDGGGDGGGGGD